MTRMSLTLAACAALLLPGAAALAKPQTKTATKNQVKVSAKNVVKDRSGNEKIDVSVENFHRTEGKRAAGTITLLDSDGAEVKTCDFELVLAAAGRGKPGGFDCYATFTDFKVELTSVDPVSAGAGDED
jgi:hypothetical protein